MLGENNVQCLASAVTSVEKSLSHSNSSSSVSLVQAFKARLSRKKLPTVNSDGLVDYVVNVANGNDGTELTGPDVDWILAASGKSCSPGVSGRKQLVSGSGPLKSAGKKLPWDHKEKVEQQSSVYMYMYANNPLLHDFVYSVLRV